MALAGLAESVRRLIATTVSVAAPADVLAAAAATVDRVVADLAAFVPAPLPPRYPGAGPGGAPGDFFPYDVVLGRLNPLAPPVEVEWLPPKAVGRVRFGTPYEGPPGCVHGAVLAAVFDQIFNVANLMQQSAGPTASLTVRYRRPTPLGACLRFEGWQERVEGRRVHAAGRCLVGEEVTVEAEAVFVQLTAERVLNMLGKE